MFGNVTRGARRWLARSSARKQETGTVRDVSDAASESDHERLEPLADAAKEHSLVAAPNQRRAEISSAFVRGIGLVHHDCESTPSSRETPTACSSVLSLER